MVGVAGLDWPHYGGCMCWWGRYAGCMCSWGRYAGCMCSWRYACGVCLVAQTWQVQEHRLYLFVCVAATGSQQGEEKALQGVSVCLVSCRVHAAYNVAPHLHMLRTCDLCVDVLGVVLLCLAVTLRSLF
jgi:hypothetical protein